MSFVSIMRIMNVCNKKIQIQNSMINNNPYNLPQRPPQKSSNIYQQEDQSFQYRKNQSVDFPHKLSSPSQYINRNHHPPIPNSTNALKKSSVNLDETLPNYKATHQPTPTQNIKHFLPSPKNNLSNSSNNIKNFTNLSGSRGITTPNTPNQRRQSLNTSTLRESFGTKVLDSKQLNDKIDSLTDTIKVFEKRLQKVERTSDAPYSPTFSTHEETVSPSVLDAISRISEKYQTQWEQSRKSINQSVYLLKQEMRGSIKSEDIDRIVHDKMKEISEITKGSESVMNSYILPEESMSQLKKQTEILKNQLQEKMRKNYDFLTAVISRIERQMYSGIYNLGSSYKSSGIRCSGSAILLRFVESFRVRKNGGKSGETKIVITDNTYYIDNEGYLLDKDQHYLVDSRGKQVKLQEKHIKMLREEQVLQ